MRIEEMSLDDISGRPSRLQIPSLLTLMPAAGATPTPAQAREIMEKMANIYEGIRIGNAEMRGISMDTPEGPVKLAAIRFNLENGKIGEFAIEGLDGRTPKGPVKVGRFALKSLDVAGLLRVAAQFTSPGQPPSPDKALALIPLIEGVELKGFDGAVQEHGQAAQHRRLQPGLEPVRRPDPEQGTPGGENVGPARRARSRAEGAGRGRPRPGGDRPRSRRRLDGNLRQHSRSSRCRSKSAAS